MDENIEKIKTAKEIADIISERAKILRLLNENNEKALAAHLEMLQQKYMVETLIYNFANPNPPKSIYENARNCISFLDCLLDTKKIEAIKEVKP